MVHTMKVSLKHNFCNTIFFWLFPVSKSVLFGERRKTNKRRRFLLGGKEEKREKRERRERKSVRYFSKKRNRTLIRNTKDGDRDGDDGK